MKHGKVCSIALDLPSVTLGHCAGGGRVGNGNATHSSSDPPPSLPRPPTICLEPREDNLRGHAGCALYDSPTWCVGCIDCFNHSNYQRKYSSLYRGSCSQQLSTTFSDPPAPPKKHNEGVDRGPQLLRHCSIIWPTEGSASSFHSWPASHLHLHDVGNMAATSDADAASKTCAPHGRDEPFYPPAYVIQPFHYSMYLPPSNIIANNRLIVNSRYMT